MIQPYLFSHHFYVLHYGPWEGSKDGTSKVLTYLHDLPDYTWQEPDQDDPLSLVDQVRKSCDRKPCPEIISMLLNILTFSL